MDYKKALVLAPHTDDGELGCGGTISKMLREGVDVHYVAFSSCKESVPKGLPEWTLKDELGKATQRLGIPKDNVQILDFQVRHFPEKRQEILDTMIRISRALTPDLVLIPSPHDIHQDHATIAQEALRAFKHICILGYELPWNNYTFNNQAFSVLEEQDVRTKVAALACYESQGFRNYFQEEYLVGMCRAHGIQIGHEYAEVFETVRWVL